MIFIGHVGILMNRFNSKGSFTLSLLHFYEARCYSWFFPNKESHSKAINTAGCIRILFIFFKVFLCVIFCNFSCRPKYFENADAVILFDQAIRKGDDGIMKTYFPNNIYLFKVNSLFLLLTLNVFHTFP